MPAHLLLVEDDSSLGSLLAGELEEAGYSCTWAPTLADGRLVLGSVRPDLVLLDVNLPDGDGFTLLREIRGRGEEGTIPVIMLTARNLSEDKVLGLDLGADDYVTKPFWTEELLARIRARLRQRPPPSPPEDLRRFGKVTLRLAARRVEVDGVEVHLTPTEFALLDHLLTRAGKAVRREDLLQAVGPDGGGESGLQAHLSRLRKKLGEDGARVRTVWGIGYRLDLE